LSWFVVRARRDLKEIWNYTARQWAAAQADHFMAIYDPA